MANTGEDDNLSSSDFGVSFDYEDTLAHPICANWDLADVCNNLIIFRKI